MFDVGFMELVLVSVIGLLVLGPQRLPKVAAELGKWIGRARRTATQLRRQLEREIELSELQTQTPPPPPAPAPTAPSSAPSPTAQPPTGSEAEAAAHSPEPTIGPAPAGSQRPEGRESKELHDEIPRAVNSRERFDTADKNQS